MAVCLLKRVVGDVDLNSGAPWSPGLPAPTGQNVAVVGSGPAGLAAAWFLRRQGHAVTIFDERAEPGGALRHSVPVESLPRDVLDAEIAGLRHIGIEFRMGHRVDHGELQDLQVRFGAVVLAIGPVTNEIAATLGLSCAYCGTLADPTTYATSMPGVFVAGDALRPRRLAVSALAYGRGAARAVHRHVSGITGPDTTEPFNSQMGRLQPGEVDVFLADAERAARAEPAGGIAGGYAKPETMAQARRCLHCDCRKADACGLRNLASTLDTRQRRFKGTQRQPFRQMRSLKVVFEPGKCIKCGLCVRLMEKAGARPGLTFLRRGADVEVGVPFHDDLGVGLGNLAAECVAVCPTGALAFKERDGTDGAQRLA